ncbi:MAG: zinc ribbon domain-containing protein [Chloroflexota bacterium]|nr:zinc ribbon domain-containing protein [Chloroflexota bacterium]
MSEQLYQLLRLSLALLGAFVGMIWIALALWVYRDAQSRSGHWLMSVLSTVLVAATFVVGWVIYLLLRPRLTLSEAYLRALHERQTLIAVSEGDVCPRCSTRLHLDYRLCPSCGLEV